MCNIGVVLIIYQIQNCRFQVINGLEAVHTESVFPFQFHECRVFQKPCQVKRISTYTCSAIVPIINVSSKTVKKSEDPRGRAIVESFAHSSKLAWQQISFLSFSEQQQFLSRSSKIKKKFHIKNISSLFCCLAISIIASCPKSASRDFRVLCERPHRMLN